MRGIDVMRLIGGGSSGGGGGGSALDTQIVTSGATGSGISQDRARGFLASIIGSVSDGTSNLYSGAVIDALYYYEGGGASAEYIFRVMGSFPNSGWTTMYVDSVPFPRSGANYFSSGGQTYWSWFTGDTPASQVFGGNGTVHTVTWE